MSTTLIDQFAAVRFAGTPLVCIRTADPAATVNGLIKAQPKETPILHWDIMRGLAPMNKPGEQALATAGGAGPKTVRLLTTLDQAAALPGCSGDGTIPGAILFIANAHRVIGEQGISQGIWNLRDVYKGNQRTLVLLCPAITLPVELQSDVTVLDEPMPDLKQLEGIVKRIYKSAELDEPESKLLESATDAICGLAAFPAEQACAESITRTGLNLPALWERKRISVEQTPGLSIWRGNTTFSDMRGCQNAIGFFKRIMTGIDAPRVIVWQDEVEKQFAGFGGDLSGTTGEAMGYQLSFMQNRNANGVLLIGPPGSGKSMLAQCCGSSFGKPTVELNISSTKASLVGQSEEQARQAFKVIDAIGQGKVMFVATCNKFGSLPPEFRRRFRDATFFCDLPTDVELVDIWKLYIAKYKIPADRAKTPSCAGWTGAEVRQCCDLAYRFRSSLAESAKYIVPVCKSAAVDILQLRQQAHNTFISAATDGVYQMPEMMAAAAVVVDAGGMRKISFDKEKVN